jgi:hypothetical protein
MFIDSVKLSRNGWYCRLQKKMFGLEPTFENFCPFFWLTVFCVLASPFYFTAIGVAGLAVILFKAFVRLVSMCERPLTRMIGVVESFALLLDKCICLPTERVFVERYDEEQVYWLYLHSRDMLAKKRGTTDLSSAWKYYVEDYPEKKHKLWTSLDRKFQIWKKMMGDGWDSRIEEIVVRCEARDLAERERENRVYKERQERIADAEVRRRKMLTTIVQYTKYVAPVVVGILILLVSYALGKVLGVVIPKVALFLFHFVRFFVWELPSSLFHSLRELFRMCSIKELSAMVLVPTIGVMLMALSRKCDLEVPFVHVGKHVKSGILFLGKPAFWFIDGVAAVVKFVIEYIKVFKANNCPHIEWED